MIKEEKTLNMNFYGQLFRLVLPMAIQNFINVGVASSDTIMLGKLSEASMSAVSIANQYQYILFILLFGIASGATVLTSQYWGKQDIKAIEMIMGICMKISIYTSFIFTAMGMFFPEFVMKIFTNDSNLIIIGSSYLRVVSISYIISTISYIYLSIIKSMEMVVISTITYGISFIINIVINYILIFGKMGIPSLGVKGAAIGTMTARMLEFIIVIIYAYKKRSIVKFRLLYFIKNNKSLKKDFRNFSLPIVINELMWGTGMAMGTAIYGHIGQSVVAANSVIQILRQLFMCISFGVCNAIAILVGKKLGEKNIKEAEVCASRLLKTAIILGVISAILLYLSKDIFVSIFNLSEQANRYLNLMILIMGLYVAAQSFTAAIIVGILRAGGDAKVGLYIDVGSMWVGSLLIGSIAAFILRLPTEVVIVIILSDEFIKIPLAYYRYKKKIWLRNITRDIS